VMTVVIDRRGFRGTLFEAVIKLESN
jgi:hypothetical protein